MDIIEKISLFINDSSVVGGSYIGGTTTNIIGSGQTRVWGVKRGLNLLDLDRKEKIEIKYNDPTKTNILGRRGLKFDSLSGAYIPNQWGENNEE